MRSWISKSPFIPETLGYCPGLAYSYYISYHCPILWPLQIWLIQWAFFLPELKWPKNSSHSNPRSCWVIVPTKLYFFSNALRSQNCGALMQISALGLFCLFCSEIAFPSCTVRSILIPLISDVPIQLPLIHTHFYIYYKDLLRSLWGHEMHIVTHIFSVWGLVANEFCCNR